MATARYVATLSANRPYGPGSESDIQLVGYRDSKAGLAISSIFVVAKASNDTINLNDNEALKFLDFPSSVKAVTLESAGKNLKLDFSKTYFNKFHYF